MFHHDRTFKSRGPRFETHQRHCVVSLEKGTLNLCLAMVQPRVYSDITEKSMTGK